jgi:hypothetical protein
MGLKLAVSLAKQLGGQLDFISDNGCRVEADLTRLGAGLGSLSQATGFATTLQRPEPLRRAP